MPSSWAQSLSPLCDVLTSVYLDEVGHGISEEHHVHAGSADGLVVLQQEHVKPLHQALEGHDGLIHLWHVKVCVLRLLS